MGFFKVLSSLRQPYTAMALPAGFCFQEGTSLELYRAHFSRHYRIRLQCNGEHCTADVYADGKFYLEGQYGNPLPENYPLARKAIVIIGRLYEVLYPKTSGGRNA